MNALQDGVRRQADRILLAADAVLLTGLAAAGAFPDLLPFPRGQDALRLVREAATPSAAHVQAPASSALPAPPPAPIPSEAPVPAPVPDPVVEKPPPPGHLEWGRVEAARRKGLDLLNAARDAGFADPGRKRTSYHKAKEAFQETLAAIDAYRAVCPEPNQAIDARVAELRQLIVECDKSSPLELKP